jgi:hypothetical protein
MRRLSHPLDPVGHAIAAGEELIEAIHWLQADGPMEAAAVAWAARKCLLHLDPGNLDDSSMRTRLYELQAEVYKVTRGSGLKSSLKWIPGRIESLLEGLRHWLDRHSAGQDGDSSQSVQIEQPAASAKTRLQVRFELAYRSFVHAEHQSGRKLKDREAYDWLKEYGLEGYEPPSFESWRRYVRGGRLHYGDQKNTPRAGRTGRSIVTPDVLEVPPDE